MEGFDRKFTDFPEYILEVTKEIWEDRGIAALNDYYSPQIVVRSPASVVVGSKRVIGATMSTLAEFPDRQLLGEDVIWSGSPETGMLSSHRIISTATHTYDGVYGGATGKKLRYRIIADCHAKNNRIDDEWLIQDQTAIVKQIGLRPDKYARDLIAQEGGPESCIKPLVLETNKAEIYRGKGNTNKWGKLHADLLQRIMRADMSAITAFYDRAATLHYPGGDTVHGWAAADAFWMGLRAAFPDADFCIDHHIGRNDTNMPPRSAIRWSLNGKHSGWGAFGRPTGAEVYIMGISHAEWGELIHGKASLRREWTLFDETAVWKQILLQTGDV
jgi:hypothetical protein